MGARFDYFILLAEMRTGSNFLEETLNTCPGLHCWGEAFNPHFVGHAGKTEMAGVSLAQREADPMRLLDAMRSRTDGMAGFRQFHDHDPRIEAHCIDDPRCAKIVLTRNPLDSFVSLAIARETGQWRLGDMKQARSAQIRFDPVAFQAHLDKVQAFQIALMRKLQTSGQTAFHLAYEDLGDIEVLNGLTRWLGIEGRIEALSARTKVQNPAALSEKVSNPGEMAAALGDMDHFNLSRTPSFEPRRGPNVPGFFAGARAPLLYMPLKGGPVARITRWLAALDGADEDALVRGMTQKALRKWKRQTKGHRSFTVLRHPVDRAHAAFCTHILPTGPESFGEIRQTLREHYGLPIPEDAPGPDYSAADHHAAFLAFLAFLKGNLGGQTGMRVDPSWASQSVLMQGMAQFTLPDAVLRETELKDGLADLAARVGREAPPLPEQEEVGPYPLDTIYDAEIEKAAREVYQRDYMMFGFGAKTDQTETV